MEEQKHNNELIDKSEHRCFFCSEQIESEFAENF